MKLKLRSSVRFLASIFAGTGTAVRKDGLATYVDLDYSLLGPLSSFDPSTKQFAIVDNLTGVWNKTTLSDVLAISGYVASSLSPATIGLGAVSFTTQAGLAYRAGARVRASSTANTANYMEGLVTSYSGTTLTFAASHVNGSGTFSSWNISLAGDPGTGDMTSTNNGLDFANIATALNNLGGVSYSNVQALSAPQKLQARTNAGAVGTPDAPTWTGKHSYTLTAGGWTSSGSPNIVGTYLGPSQKFGIVADATALQAGPNQPETTMVVNMTTAAGLFDPVGSFKTAFGATITANNGAADVWAQSNVVTLGDSNARGGVPLELDLNNFSGVSQSGTPSTPYVGNLILTGQNTNGVSTPAVSDFAIGIMNAVNPGTHMWNYGIYAGPPDFGVFAQAFIFDETACTYGYVMKGTKTTGIDMSNCTTSNAIFINNNSAILSLNAARSASLNLLKVDSSNNIVLGQSSGVAQITVAQHLVPDTDNTYTLGKSGARWNALWAANGTIQTSDMRAKKDFEGLPEALPIIMSVAPRSYRWKDGADTGRHWGLIAQELDAAINKTGAEFAGINKDDPDHWGLNYAETNAILWQAIRELNARIDRLSQS